MSENSPLEAYCKANTIFLDILEFQNEPGELERLRAQLVILQSCFQRLMQVADSQDPDVWNVLGFAFDTGRGAKHDRAEAIYWYQRAAEAGHAPAMVSLAQRLLYPMPSSDAAAAIRWLRKAAESGYSGGMVSLGFAYRAGEGVPCDYGEAVRWFKKAVEAGDSHSMIHVGRVYAHNLDSPADAVAWFRRASEAGFSESFIELAILYNDRESELYNPAEAHKWYRVVAEYSEGTASHALLAITRQYLEGVGVPCDVKLAKFWLRRLMRAVPKEYSAHREAQHLLAKLEDQFL